MMRYCGPALVIMVVIAVIGSAFTFRRHRNPLPMVVTLAGGAWIYWFAFHATSHGGHMNDHMGDNMAQPSNLVWIGLAALIGAQVYDAYRTTRACRAPRRSAANMA
jgi:threonine/homoserine/homoserine lactone efflux protein